MTDDGIPLSQRQRLFDLITAAIDAGSPGVYAPVPYEGDLDYDVTVYVEANRTVDNGLYVGPLIGPRIAIADNRGPVLVIERAAQVREAA